MQHYSRILTLCVFSFFVFTLSIISGNAYAEQTDNVTEAHGSYSSLSLVASEGDYNEGDVFWLGLKFSLDDGWHSYWKNPGDAGFPPSLTWTHNDSVKIGAIHWPIPKRITYESLTDYGYHHDSTLLLPVTLSEGAKDSVISLKADWLVCNNICVPETATLNININDLSTIADAQVISNAEAALPTLSKAKASLTYDETNSNIINVTLPLGDDAAAASADAYEIYPATANTTTSAKPFVTIENNTITSSIELLSDTTIYDDFKVLLLQKGERAKQYSFTGLEPKNTAASEAPQTQPSISFALALLFALLGGIILNIMPCVLPVLSLKVLSAVKKAEKSRSEVIKHGIAYTLGIILSFVALALIIVILQKGGEHIGWGFQMQSPGFVMFMTVVFFLLGMNLSGKFELPHMFGNTGGNLANSDGPSGSFFTGVLATLAATPCTVPFMAPAVGLALTLSALENISIFIALGFGMALPYLAITLIPAFSHFIPKPGAWMHRFKQWLAIPIYATVAYMMWVLYTQTSIAGVIVAAFAMLFIHMIISWRSRIKASALIIGALIVLSIGLIANLPNTSLSKLSGDAFKQTLATAKEDGAVLVDVTASWCMTCQFNALTLHSDSVKSYLDDNNISLITADWTHQDEVISKYLKSFGRNGVPLYVFYPKDGGEPLILPQLLTEDNIKENTAN